ncbi:MAG: hypothetical protein Q8R40_05065 [bacterium]|nr:hypothetical protein [bacterium]
MARRPMSNVHKHLCLKCSTQANPTVWEHDDRKCFVPYATAKDCLKCAAGGGGGGDDSPKDWSHDHHCSVHNHDWAHVDKSCLLGRTKETGIPEVYELNCPGPGKTSSASQKGETGQASQTGGTAQVSRNKMVICPQCGTKGAKQTDGADGITGYDEFVCMKCGTEFVL